MIDNSIKQLVIPPGGWKYQQPIENSSAYPIEGQTYPMLENRVFEFRLANVEIIPSGTATRESVRDDLRGYICSQFPNQCTGYAPSPTPVATDVSSLPLISRLDDWFKKLAYVNIEWKDAVTANADAATCSGCRQNIQWRTGCAPCVSTVQRRTARYKGDRATSLDSSLLGCRCFGHLNELAVWMKNPHSNPKETPPENCWNK